MVLRWALGPSAARNGLLPGKDASSRQGQVEDGRRFFPAEPLALGEPIVTYAVADGENPDRELRSGTKRGQGAVRDYNAYDDPNSAQCTMHRGIVTTMVGFAILIGLSFIGYHAGDGPFSPATIHPGPWLLGGLIPMFVGIAQIIIGLLSGAAFTFHTPQPGPGPYAPPPGQRPDGAPQPGEPGPRYEELARPVPPPDRT